MVTLAAALARYTGVQTFNFGDTPALIAELTARVRAGRKRATCTALDDIEAGRESRPQVGRRDIALDASGVPALMIETIELRETTWEAMTEQMALMEGEDETLARGAPSLLSAAGHLRSGHGPDLGAIQSCRGFRVRRSVCCEGAGALPRRCAAPRDI